jgi:hypothetical protein
MRYKANYRQIFFRKAGQCSYQYYNGLAAWNLKGRVSQDWN